MTTETKTGNVNTEQSDGQNGRGKSTLTKVLPTDRLTFEKQVALARAFAAIYEANGGKPVSNDEAGETVTPAMKAGTVIQVNAFFADIGLVPRSEKGGFVPSAELIAYNKNFSWDAKIAKDKLKPLFERTWFYRCLVPRLQLASQPLSTCIAVLADESGAKKEHEERLRHLLSFLELANIVSIVGNSVSLSSGGAPLQTPPPELPLKPEDQNKRTRTPQGEEHILYLSEDKQRSISLTAPLSITRPEYERLVKWIEVQLIVPPKQDDSAR